MGLLLLWLPQFLSYLEAKKNPREEATCVVTVMASHTNKVVKALHQDKESQKKEQKAYEGQLVDLMTKVNKKLDQALQMMYGDFNQDNRPTRGAYSKCSGSLLAT